MSARYRWDTPHEWLYWKARDWSAAQLFQELLCVTREMDCDTLQDIYQSDMAADGYFKATGEDEQDDDTDDCNTPDGAR